MPAEAPPRVSALYVYPVKGCGGLPLVRAEVSRMGIRRDRQWMFVDERGMFVAQRDSRRLGVPVASVCLVRTALDAESLTLTAPGMPPLSVPVDGAAGDEVPVHVWESHTLGIDQGAEAEQWATTFLSRERPGRYRLVRMPDQERRVAKVGVAELAYADAYPFLVISEASLADLNRRLAVPLPMNRFRPNIVVSGCGPYAEDGFDHFTIGGIYFSGTTLCLRCPTTVTDQETAERGVEPLRTLATYRRQPNGVVFGRNFNHTGTGTLRVGDAIGRIARTAAT